MSALSVIVSNTWSVRQELRALGLTPEIVTNIARQTAAAKADALEIDPCGTPGTFAYIHGVRATRLHLLPLKGWRISRIGNVESTVNDDLGIQLVFQNVDSACTPRNPQAISGKGAGARELVACGKQGELFTKDNAPEGGLLGVTPTVWMFCVNAEGKRLRAEVSCPNVFEGNQFSDFSRRIFVVNEIYDGPDLRRENAPSDNDDGTDEIEIRIARKK